MKRILEVLTGVVFIGCATFLVTAWRFSTLLLQPEHRGCSKEHYIHCGDPADLGLRYEEVAFETVDGLAISGWFIKGRQLFPGLLLVHGAGASRFEMFPYVLPLHRAGLSLLLIDLRNCGESDEAFSSMGYHERKDIHAGVDFLLNEKGIRSVGVFGNSLGAGAGIMAMAENPSIRAGIFENPFTSFDQRVGEKLKMEYGLPAFLLLPAVKFFFELRSNSDMDTPSPLSSIRRISPRSVLIIDITAEEGSGFSEGKQLYQAADRHGKLLSIPSEMETMAWQVATARTEKEILQFLLDTL